MSLCLNSTTRQLPHNKHITPVFLLKFTNSEFFDLQLIKRRLVIKYCICKYILVLKLVTYYEIYAQKDDSKSSEITALTKLYIAEVCIEVCSSCVSWKAN